MSSTDGDPKLATQEQQGGDLAVSDIVPDIEIPGSDADRRLRATRDQMVAQLRLGGRERIRPETIDSRGGDPTRGGRPTNAVPESIKGNWDRILESGLPDSTYAQLLGAAEEAAGSAIQSELREGSLRTFLSFWDAVRSIAPEPSLALTPDGNLIAEWRKDSKHHVDVVFKSDGLVLYGIFLGKMVSEGRGTVERLVDNLVRDRAWAD